MTAKSSRAAPPIYTKTGDEGTSALYNGERRSKTNVVFDVLGTIDELNSHIGLARAHHKQGGGDITKQAVASVPDALEFVQRRLLDLGSICATPTSSGTNASVAPLPYQPKEWTVQLEQWIDAWQNALPPLTEFILPGGGSVVSAELHVCRTVCRRAERLVVDLVATNGSSYGPTLRDGAVFMNRLSDFFFAAARITAAEEQKRR